jgi:hypothetical protein
METTANMPVKIRRTVPMNTGTKQHKDVTKFDRSKRHEWKKDFRREGIIMEGMDMKMRRGSTGVVASADSDYKAKVREVRKTLDDIEKAIKYHETRQKNNPLNYGYVGDMGHVQSKLLDAVSSL